MANHYRHVKCPDCPAILRLAISQETFGKMVIVTCPKCGVRCRTTIPKPPPTVRESMIRQSAEDLLRELYESVTKLMTDVGLTAR